MVLGTADEDGLPWTSPVYYAHEGYATFYWVSAPERQHSRNLAVRPQLSIVIFDSGAPIYSGQAVYMSAEARQASGGELERGIAIFESQPGAWIARVEARRCHRTGRAPALRRTGVRALDPGTAHRPSGTSHPLNRCRQ